MKVGFYLENKNIPKVDLSNPEKGNPGCGGTEFLFASLPYYLSKMQSDKCTPVLLANVVNHLPANVETIEVDDVYQAARAAKHAGCDVFVYRPKRREEMDVLALFDSLELAAVGWAHITPTTSYLRKMAHTEKFKALVCVEGEQCDQVQDSPVTNKLTCIVNGFDVDGFQLECPPEKDPRLVVYLGALVPQKGFHLLAKVWPRVLQRVCDAKLTVIGTGALYDSKAVLGPWGIAEKSYEENQIIPYLGDENGQPHPSVEFVGKLGLEKKGILARALVGVPNPTGETENCPGSSLEFSASGTAIVSGAYYGLLDTVSHGRTGLLGRSEDDLVDNICSLLEHPEMAWRLAKNGPHFVRGRYGYDAVTKAWVDLFERIVAGKRPPKIPLKRNLHRHYKWLIAVNRPLQLTLGALFDWPSVMQMKECLYPCVLGVRMKIRDLV